MIQAGDLAVDPGRERRLGARLQIVRFGADILTLVGRLISLGISLNAGH